MPIDFDDKEPWHIRKEVTVSTVLALIVLFVSTVSSWFEFNNKLAILNQKIEAQKTLTKQELKFIDDSLQRQSRAVEMRLNSIDAKLTQITDHLIKQGE